MATTAALLGALAGSVAAQSEPAAAGASAPPPAKNGNGRGNDGFAGYDFGQVVATMETSVNPLQREMDQSFRVFGETIEEAERLLDEGETHEAVQKASAALDVVLAARERVLTPMWDGQQVLGEQIALARARLAAAVQASTRGKEPVLDTPTEKTLDGLARRISAEGDPLRKKRLVAHYRTVRNLARIRAMAVQLSPDQRKMWMSVLHVLDEAALAHQRVMMGSEVLFAQFEATSSNLKSYLSLMDTVDGASRLIRMVRGAGDNAAGMAGFAESMGELQQRLAGFNESVEQALEGRMIELEAEMDMIAPLPGELGGIHSIAVAEDNELAGRITRLSKPAAAEGDRP
ncbi:MAG: hypothetical protein GY715_07315 [Planctomycetes bacterium]|nr:hypothetical protein [Planctomycetota bacterium]